jgi:hypothetical protein
MRTRSGAAAVGGRIGRELDHMWQLPAGSREGTSAPVAQVGSWAFLTNNESAKAGIATTPNRFRGGVCGPGSKALDFRNGRMYGPRQLEAKRDMHGPQTHITPGKASAVAIVKAVGDTATPIGPAGRRSGGPTGLGCPGERNSRFGGWATLRRTSLGTKTGPSGREELVSSWGSLLWFSQNGSLPERTTCAAAAVRHGGNAILAASFATAAGGRVWRPGPNPDSAESGRFETPITAAVAASAIGVDARRGKGASSGVSAATRGQLAQKFAEQVAAAKFLSVHRAIHAYTEGAYSAASGGRAHAAQALPHPVLALRREDSDGPHNVRRPQEHGPQHDGQQHVKTSETGTMTLSGCTTGSAHLDRMTNAAGRLGHAGHLSF